MTKLLLILIKNHCLEVNTTKTVFMVFSNTKNVFRKYEIVNIFENDSYPFTPDFYMFRIENIVANSFLFNYFCYIFTIILIPCTCYCKLLHLYQFVAIKIIIIINPRKTSGPRRPSTRKYLFIFYKLKHLLC